MNDKLRLLITYYEDELNAFNQSLKACIEETDFLAAHRFQHAIYKTQTQLKTFKNLLDNLYDEKESIRNTIAWIDQSIATGNPTSPLPYYNEILISNKQQQLEKLKIAELRPIDNDSFNAFNETLQKLINKEIKSFTLTLNKRYNTHLIFSLKNKNTFKITIPIITTNYLTLIDDSVIRTLNNAGFKLIANKKLVALLPNKTTENIAALKTMISKIVFEVFVFGQYHESFIEYKKLHPENKNGQATF